MFHFMRTNKRIWEYWPYMYIFWFSMHSNSLSLGNSTSIDSPANWQEPFSSERAHWVQGCTASSKSAGRIDLDKVMSFCDHCCSSVSFCDRSCPSTCGVLPAFQVWGSSGEKGCYLPQSCLCLCIYVYKVVFKRELFFEASKMSWAVMMHASSAWALRAALLQRRGPVWSVGEVGD